MQISVTEGLKKLIQSGKPFTELFTHGTLLLEIYKPVRKDFQQPHDRDEIYIVISGSGDFFNDGKTSRFQTGDFLFVKAGAVHRFENFTDDFSTWVIFYGPTGGESADKT